MYAFFALFLTFVLLILTVGGEAGRGRNCPRAFFFANLVLSAAGAVFILTAFLLARYRIFGGAFDAEFTGWAWDMLAVYYRLSLIPCVVFLAVSALACLVAAADPKQRNGFPLKLRLSVTVVFSVVMLLLAPMYSFVTVNGKVARASYEVRVGDVIAIRFGEKTLTVEVTAVQETVGKSDAATLYREV